MGQIAELHAALRGHAWKCSFTSPDEWEEIQDTTNERFVSSEKDSLSFFAAISKYIVRYSLNRFANLFFTNRHRSRGWRKILSKQSYRYNFAISVNATRWFTRVFEREKKSSIFVQNFLKKKKITRGQKIRCTRETTPTLVRDSIRIRRRKFVPFDVAHVGWSSVHPTFVR